MAVKILRIIVLKYKIVQWRIKGFLDGSAILLLPSATKLRRLCFYRCVSVHRGVCSRGVLGPGGVSARGGLLPGGAWSWGDVCSRRIGIPACTEADTPCPPRRDGYCCGWYTSYCNAFLFWSFFPLELHEILRNKNAFQ